MRIITEVTVENIKAVSLRTNKVKEEKTTV